jgi:hypothetical protein
MTSRRHAPGSRRPSSPLVREAPGRRRLRRAASKLADAVTPQTLAAASAVPPESRLGPQRLAANLGETAINPSGIFENTTRRLSAHRGRS